MYISSFLEVCKTGGPCHLAKEFFAAAIALVWVTARWRKNTGEDTLSLRRTTYSNRMCTAVDVKGKFQGTYS
jgi:hypothetical protein